jgi:hypothetical protein
MPKVTVLPPKSLGKDFIPARFLINGNGQYDIRNRQSVYPPEQWRNLKSDEIERLVKNQNTADNWDKILVTDEFDPSLIRNNKFFGLVRIGSVRDLVLRHHDLKLGVGITNSLIINCDIGNDTAIHNVQYLAHYIVGDRCILFNIMEMNTTDHAKFGNGIIKEGEDENVRVWIDLINEAGLRQVLPFDGMLPADAWLWARYRDDSALQSRLKAITQGIYDERRGYYGTIGNECVIKNSHTLKDIKVGAGCYVKGANKIKNVTINSSEEEPTQIGEGVELVNGIIGYGCRIFYGCKAVRFILGNNSNLKYGARLINSFLGDNSTISCCEVLNSLIFPAHEQHHNNSFLVASVVLGQSNVAAGATIGSNHNSRANDSEIIAGRGFWPGLCVSLKHSSRFASFTLLSKGDYPYELDVRLPFSLVANNSSKDQLELMPAYWWMYNMYALERNSRKFVSRDMRMKKLQNIEFETLAPDTVEEIIQAMIYLEIWTARAWLRSEGKTADNLPDEELSSIGKDILTGSEESVDRLEIHGEKMERSGRKVVILKAHRAYHSYRDMLVYYGVINLADFLAVQTDTDLDSMCRYMEGRRETSWVNMGGQLIPESEITRLRRDIGTGKLRSWQEIHHRYDELWNMYGISKQQHAFATLCHVYNVGTLTGESWDDALEQADRIKQFICDQVYLSRKKDYDNPFRIMIFRNKDEMNAVLGDIEDNEFITRVREETSQFHEKIGQLRSRFRSMAAGI